VRGELGRELEARGELARAEGEFRAVVAASTGDNRTLAPALRDLGRILAGSIKNAEALTTLKKALATAGGEAASAARSSRSSPTCTDPTTTSAS